MPTNPIALVAAAWSSAQALETESLPSSARTPSACSFAQVGQWLACGTDGMVVLAAGARAATAPVVHAVQTLHQRQTATTAMVIAAEGRPADRLPRIDVAADVSLSGPRNADVWARLTRERRGHGRNGHACAALPLTELLRNRLLVHTPSLVPLAEQIALAAAHDVTVLLNGETGTGKTFLARLIHDHSPRRQRRFLQVACGAIAANLVESEFFGHVRGAFTGADRSKIGKFAAVEQGTLLLDEIDTLGLEQQATLLRVIETGEFEPVGSIETQTSNARLIVASNADLEEAVACGKFRPDLYFRLNVMSFHLPPLRERVQDIYPLARMVTERFSRKFNKRVLVIRDDALAALESYPWPGNIRQLENVLQTAVLVCPGSELTPDHLPPALQEHVDGPRLHHANGFSNGQSPRRSLHHQRDVHERAVIQQALVDNGYNRSHAARKLGISRVTLHKKLRKYGLLRALADTAAG